MSWNMHRNFDDLDCALSKLGDTIRDLDIDADAKSTLTTLVHKAEGLAANAQSEADNAIDEAAEDAQNEAVTKATEHLLEPDDLLLACGWFFEHYGYTPREGEPAHIHEGRQMFWAIRGGRTAGIQGHSKYRVAAL